MKIVVRGARRAEEVRAAAEAGADAVAFVVESKGDPANVDITEAVETARLAPPFLSVLVWTTTTDEARLRRSIGSLHPHGVVFEHDLDPMVLADLQVSFPEVKWFARLQPTQYEPFHDAADALVIEGGSRDDAAKVMEAARTRVMLTDLAAARELRPFGVVVRPDDVASARALREGR